MGNQQTRPSRAVPDQTIEENTYVDHPAKIRFVVVLHLFQTGSKFRWFQQLQYFAEKVHIDWSSQLIKCYASTDL